MQTRWYLQQPHLPDAPLLLVLEVEDVVPLLVLHLVVAVVLLLLPILLLVRSCSIKSVAARPTFPRMSKRRGWVHWPPGPTSHRLRGHHHHLKVRMAHLQLKHWSTRPLMRRPHHRYWRMHSPKPSRLMGRPMQTYACERHWRRRS